MAIEKMKNAVASWTDIAREAKLSRQNFWLMVDRRLKPKMFYRLGMNMAGFKELWECLLPQYYNLLLLGGIQQSVRTGL